MKQFKKQLYFSSLAIALILVFSIYAYYQIRSRTHAHKEVEKAVDDLIAVQSLTDETAQTITILSVHAGSFPNQTYKAHHTDLKQLIDSLTSAQRLLENRLNGKEQPKDIQQHLAFASLYHKNLVTQATQLISDTARKFLDDYSFVRKVRTYHTKLKKAHLDLHSALEAAERGREKELASLNLIVLVALLAALVILIFVMLAPSIRKTERSFQEKAAAEKRYRDLFHHNPLPIWIYDLETGHTLEVNEQAIQHYGYTRQEFIAMPLFDLWENNGTPEIQPQPKDPLNTTSLFNGKWMHTTKSGQSICVEMLSHKIQYGEKEALLILANDITSQVQLETQLLEEKISRQKEITKAIIDTQENERSEIGKELHDNVNQVLTTIKLYIENIKAYPEHSSLFIEKSVALTQRTINEVRFLAKQLVTPVMQDLGFKATIDELTAHYESLQLFEIIVNFDVDEDRLDTAIKLTIYRIIQEQLTNIVKYAKGSLVQLTVQEENDRLKVIVEDNGVGFDLQKTHEGIGLKNIKNRAEAYKGILRITSSEGNGCRLEVDFPSRKLRKALQIA
jgi:PAS domain S-box-containing protein